MVVGVICKCLVVVEMEYGDLVVVCYMMFLLFLYDYCVVDGMLGGFFLCCVVDYMEVFDLNCLL